MAQGLSRFAGPAPDGLLPRLTFAYFDEPMKIEMDIAIQAAPETIWGILADFSAYPEWNPYIHSVRGTVAPESDIEMDLLYHHPKGKPEGLKATEKVKVTAFAAPRYFSWVWTHGRGDWWLSAERVFRIKLREDGKCTFFNEAYYSGISAVKLLGFLEINRDRIEHRLKLPMIKMNEALRDRAEAAQAARP
jgi:hypothetical protein